ncbi:MAG: hypothetical protein K6T86_07070 [Pirellulales bacterium]|nr:hypothetical protein [Pirellulales bacterium]
MSELASGKQYDHAQVTDQMMGVQLPAARRLKQIVVLHVHPPPNCVAVAHHNVGSHTRTLGCPLQRAGVYWQFFQPRTRAANAVKNGVVEGYPPVGGGHLLSRLPGFRRHRVRGNCRHVPPGMGDGRPVRPPEGTWLSDCFDGRRAA